MPDRKTAALVILVIASPVLLFGAWLSFSVGCFLCLDEGQSLFGLGHDSSQALINMLAVFAFVIAAWAVGKRATR